MYLGLVKSLCSIQFCVSGSLELVDTQSLVYDIARRVRRGSFIKLENEVILCLNTLPILVGCLFAMDSIIDDLLARIVTSLLYLFGKSLVGSVRVIGIRNCHLLINLVKVLAQTLRQWLIKNCGATHIILVIIIHFLV